MNVAEGKPIGELPGLRLDAGFARQGNAVANEERHKRGWETIDIVGWEVPPQYDPQTNNLEWAIRGRSDSGDVVNYNVRYLGRQGVMEVSLVVDPVRLATTLPTFRGLLDGYGFNTGHG